MATIKISFDKRADHTTKDKKFPLVLRIGHARKTRDIPFNLHLKENQYDFTTGKVTGILNAVRHTKRIRKIYSDVDLWMDEHASEIKYWEIKKLKSEIEEIFFKKSPARSILSHGAVYLNRLRLEERFSTASSYEDALKALIKFRKNLKGQDDTAPIKTLYRTEDKKLKVLEDLKELDMEIKAMDYAFLKDFKAYMSNRYKSRNTPAIHLRSLQAIMNDAGKTYSDLRDHKPLSSIKKQSHENAPEPLSLEDIMAIRNLELKPQTPIWHTRNYLLFMFNNMGMNHYDMATIKRYQFEDNRIKYYRKKTHYEGDYFSVLQNEEALRIIGFYLNGQEPKEYLFPIIPADTTPDRLYKVNNGKVKIFNKYAKRIADLADIEKKITTYTLRDTWTNIGLDMGIDIRKISSGLGHSSVQVTEKHYGKSVSEKILDEINAKITKVQSP
ncbi:Site-specific recombinase XerD [Flagellimonas taeanensis]|uniref:Site-specific recombinase XerD n=1 Tax=Flagellimonas taeanensis TaxID=1005926 RepID=A0A1M6Y3V1_9FLAO|nr:phage integrase SAM-like domain-containing protein [Allomuricauda taeanensis]SFC05299.1 Site-specific recombinase XerD [Allomuricauda taeanensis]SHL12961.1 Site-specific recombinase XerD [Allomuricauda taeanensis]